MKKIGDKIVEKDVDELITEEEELMNLASKAELVYWTRKSISE